MSHSRFFDYDEQTGITKIFHWDDATETYTIESIADVEDIVEDNLFQANTLDKGNWKGDMHKVASIPLTIYYELKRAGIIDDPKRLKAWLNDNENMKFRTKMGRV